MRKLYRTYIQVLYFDFQNYLEIQVYTVMTLRLCCILRLQINIHSLEQG